MAVKQPNVGRELWLDGLRGVAAAIVAWFHFTTGSLKTPYRSFWAEPAEQNRQLIQMAPFRLIFAGQAMVDIFFIVSGYSVSVGLARLRNNEDASVNFYRKLTSSVFRRLIRLFVPVVAMSAISHFFFYFNFYAWGFPDTQGCPGAQPLSSPLPHLKCFLRSNLSIMNLETGQNLSLNDHFWTLPVEARGSMAIYLSTLGLASVGHTARIVLITIIGLRYFWIGSPEFFAFFVGYLFAELDVGNQHLALPMLDFPEKGALNEWIEKCRRPAKYLLFAIGIYMLCLPVADPFPPEWGFLAWVPMPYWVEWEIRMRSCHTIGAMFVIGTLRYLPTMRKPFESDAAQFLGRISFSLYLLHQTVYRILLTRILDWVSWLLLGVAYWKVEKDERTFYMFLAWATATGVIGCLLAFASRAMAKSIDQRSVAWGYHVERLLTR